MWVQAALPLGIIGGMLCAMGHIQYNIHKFTYGRVCIFFFNLFASFIRYRSMNSNLGLLLLMLIINRWEFNLRQPKHVCGDLWDTAMERRDKKLIEKFTATSHN